MLFFFKLTPARHPVDYQEGQWVSRHQEGALNKELPTDVRGFFFLTDRPLAKGRAILENGVSGTLLVRIEARIEAGLLLTYAEVTGPGSGGVVEGQSRLEI